MDNTKRPQGISSWSNPHLTKGYEDGSVFTNRSDLEVSEKKSAPMHPNCSAPETPAKAQLASSPSMRVGEGWQGSPGDTGERRVGKDRGTSGSSGSLSTATSRNLATDLERKLETKTKHGGGTVAVTKSSTTTNHTSEQRLCGAPGVFNDTTVPRSGPLDSKTKQLASSPHTDTCLDYFGSIHASKPSPANEARSRRPSDRTSQPQRSAIVSTEGSSVSNPCIALPSAQDRETGLPDNVSVRSNFSGRCSQSDGQVPLVGDTVHESPLRRSPRLNSDTSGDIPKTGPLVETKTFTFTFPKPSQWQTPVRTFEKESTQSASVQRTDKGGPQLTELQRLPNLDSSAPITKISASSTNPRLASPKIKVHSSNATTGEGDSDSHSSVSSPIASYSPLPSVNTQTSLEKENGDYCESSPPVKEESTSEDDSCNLALASPSLDRSCRSVSTAMIRTPSPGGLNVIWKWVNTEKRERMLPTFYWIVQSLSPNLGTDDMKEGFIYAIKTKEPEGRNYLKIGWTDNVDQRMKDHKKCYGEVERVYPPKGQLKINLPHAYRVERLIHAELVQQSMLVEFCPYNRQVHKAHREWFDVDERHAIAVIRKWSEWIMTAPYREVPVIQNIQSKTPNTKNKSGGKRNANSAEPRSQDGTPTKTTTPKEPATTVWQLRNLDQESLMEMCWPLDTSATEFDDQNGRQGYQ